MTKLELVENSSQNPSPGEITLPNTPTGVVLEIVEEGCSKNKWIKWNKFNSYCQILLIYQYLLRIPQPRESTAF